MPTTYADIYAMVKRIPRGRVATYGQIAALAGIPKQPRRVGYALSALPDDHNVPWHRVINAKGEISLRADGYYDRNQRRLLENEGISLDEIGKISLKQFQWRPRRK